MFWLEEGHPAALAPGKRPRTTLSPTLALRDGEPYLAWGSPGGDGQDQWITQFFMRHVHCGMNLQEAIDAPAWHCEHFPSSFWPRTARPGVLVVEGRVPKKTVDELKRRGHLVEVGPGLVGRPAHGGLARRPAPPRRRQSTRHAELRGGAVGFSQEFQQRGAERRRLLQRRHMPAVLDDLQRSVGNGLRQQSRRFAAHVILSSDHDQRRRPDGFEQAGQQEQ